MTKKNGGEGAILALVDFSPISETVVDHAAKLADDLRKPLTVLHVVHDPGEAPGYYRVKGRKKLLRRSEEVAQEMLDQFMTDARVRVPDSQSIGKGETMLVVGIPVTRILEVVDLTRPWMVVLGSAGRTGLSHVLLGSKAEQVARLCPVPVCIVKVSKED